MTNDKIRQAIDLINSGDREQAYVLLKEIVQENPQNEVAWFWLASCAATKEEKLDCLTRVLEINPQNQAARQAINKLTGEYGDDVGYPNMENLFPDEMDKPQITGLSLPSTVKTGYLQLFAAILAIVVIVSMVMVIVRWGFNMVTIPFFATSTPTQTSTASITPTSTYTYTPTITSTATVTPTPSHSPTSTISPTPSHTATSTHTLTSTPTATPYLVTLPWKVRTGDGWDFTITDVSLKTSIGDKTPEKDYLLVILFEAVNKTGKADILFQNCLKADQFSISLGAQSIMMDKKFLDAAKGKYQRDYPGTVFGQCIKSGESGLSVLVFDVPDVDNELELELRDRRVRLGKVATLLNRRTD